jgi:hypothetical protein
MPITIIPQASLTFSSIISPPMKTAMDINNQTTGAVFLNADIRTDLLGFSFILSEFTMIDNRII